MRRLYIQIYLALVAILVLFGVLAVTAWLVLPPDAHRQRLITGSAALLGDLLPAPERPVAETKAALERIHNQLGADLSLYDSDGTLLAAAGKPLEAPDLSGRKSGWIHGHGRGPRVALHLDDGRWLIVRAERDGGGAWLALLLLLAVAVAIGAYPLVRRLTRRLERLQERVEQLGMGDLSARVEVQGSDEVAGLARSFNRTAERLERLVEAQRGILAGASHELRTPLTRIRMGLELLADADNKRDLHARMSRDIRELDALIEELLLASRLGAGESLDDDEPVELLALCAEEGARVGARVGGAPVTLRGDSRTLRRLLRNLFENASRHGGGAEIDACVEPAGNDGVRIVVSDAGPGVAESERERIFTPFYRVGGAGGSGLGLALVRQIARRHGGDARCVPREGGGSRFEVTLASR